MQIPNQYQFNKVLVQTSQMEMADSETQKAEAITLAPCHGFPLAVKRAAPVQAHPARPECRTAHMSLLSPPAAQSL